MFVSDFRPASTPWIRIRGSAYFCGSGSRKPKTCGSKALFRIGYCTIDKYFLYKWSIRLKSMNNHMAGWATTVISPFYFILLGYPFTCNNWIINLRSWDSWKVFWTNTFGSQLWFKYRPKIYHVRNTINRTVVVIIGEWLIDNGTLKACIWQIMWKILHFYFYLFILTISSMA